MTTVSAADARRPLALHESAAPPRSLKRHISTTVPGKLGSGEDDNKILRHPAAKDLAPKRQKLGAPIPASPALPDPPSTDQGATLPNAPRLARAQSTKRLPLEFVDGFFLGSEGIQESPPQSPLTGRSSPPLLPQRPWKHGSVTRMVSEGTLNNPGVRRRNDVLVQTVPYKTEPSQDAPWFMAGKTADFAPWIGNHPEDVLNDQTVKHGFVDRIPISQNETNTARQSLYGLFKHKSGLQSLSALFASVVEERQAHNKIFSGSAFKPPPRVTLTEAKRKTWLNDLADSSVPLRKLSRTIPQGIRGQTLLDQCFANSVPMGRALWFAKCVGANEIRTLKRKGASTNFAAAAEIKWLRDWTINIEQFLESSIEHCGQAGWRPRMTYAMSLSVRLYDECLLDRDHYLDWIVKSVSSASVDGSPIWLLLVHLHQTDLIKYRRRGRQLSRSLLEKLCTATKLDPRTHASLIVKLKQLVRSIIHKNLGFFVMSHSWTNYRGVLESCLELDTAAGQQLLNQLSYRNGMLSTAFDPSSSKPRTPRQLLINILDSAKSPFDILVIAQDCRYACDDLRLFVTVILEWSSSRFRAGKYRVFLAVRLLQFIHDEVDITSAVIDFLNSPQSHSGCDSACLHALISELVCSRVFALSRYLQSLIARGYSPQTSPRTRAYAPSTSREDENESSESLTGLDPAGVLTAVPLYSLTPTVRNLRDILLERAGFSLSHEANFIKSCKGYVATQLPRIVQYEIDPGSRPSAPEFTQLSWSVISEIALFLKQHILSFGASVEASASKDSSQDSPGSPVSAITDAEFRRIRSICEELGIMSVLADIIKSCMASNDEKLLASIADTVNFHLDALSALGSFEDLHESLFRTYLSMRTSQGLPRQFIVSLISLGSIISSSLVSVSSLQQDLASGDKNVAVAACSPVSDGMAGSLQQAGPAFTEEFEAVLSTGNRMEEQTMTQLFNVLAERLEKGYYGNEPENDEALCVLHARLRIYRRAQFDILIAAWLQRLFTMANPRVKQLLPMLISTSCVLFETCVDIFLSALHSNENATPEGLAVRTHLASFLEIIAAAEQGIDSVSYKLKLGNARHIKHSPDRALQLRTQTGLGNYKGRVHLSNDLLIHYVLQGQAGARLPESCPPGTITSALNSLLLLLDDGSDLAFPELVQKTTELSMPFCRLRLQLWAAVPSLPTLCSGPEAVVETLIDLAKSDKDHVLTFYTSSIGIDMARQVRERAEEAFFAIPIFAGSGRNQANLLPIATGIEEASSYLKIVALTAHSIPSSGLPTIAPVLVDRLGGVLRGLIAGRLAASNDNIKQAPDQLALSNEEVAAAGNLDQLTAHLKLLLQMTVIHRTGLVSSRSEPLSSPVGPQRQSQQDVVKVLVLLTSIGLHPLLNGSSILTTYIFDVAATIVDDASDDVRVLCARILKDKMRDQRAEHLFGSANNMKERESADATSRRGWIVDGLQIMKEGKRVAEYRSRNWEMLEGGVEASISLSLFDTKREV